MITSAFLLGRKNGSKALVKELEFLCAQGFILEPIIMSPSSVLSSRVLSYSFSMSDSPDSFSGDGTLNLCIKVPCLHQLGVSAVLDTVPQLRKWFQQLI